MSSSVSCNHHCFLSPSVSLELLHSPLNHRTIEVTEPLHSQYHAHTEHTKTLQGLDIRQDYNTEQTQHPGTTVPIAIMATPEVLSCIFHEQDPLIAPRRSLDDLPAHVKGIIRWYPDAQPTAGYYVPKKYSPSGDFEPVKFINNQWFGLFGHPEISTTHLCTRASEAIPIINRLGIGYWDITEPQHPDFTSSNIAPINIDPPEDNNFTRSNSPTAQTLPANPTHYNTPTPDSPSHQQAQQPKPSCQPALQELEDEAEVEVEVEEEVHPQQQLPPSQPHPMEACVAYHLQCSTGLVP